jgi:prolyl oligopeptidase
MESGAGQRESGPRWARAKRRSLSSPKLGLLLGTAALLLLSLAPSRVPARGQAVAEPQPPPTQRVDVTNNYFGTIVHDPYRWLEDQESPQTRAWIDAQVSYTRAVLNRLAGREKLQAKIRALLDVDRETVPWARGGRYFFMQRKKGSQLYTICLRQGVGGKDQILVDPASLSADLSTSVRIESVSFDGKLLAYSVQHGGEDASSVRIFDVDHRRDLPDLLPTNYYEGISFTHDDRSFYYSRYGTEGPRVFLHRLGTDPKADALIFGQGIGPKSEVGLNLSDDGRYLVFDVAHGWTHDDIYLKDLTGDGPVLTLVKGLDARFEVQVGGQRLFVLTDWKAARGRILTGDLDHPELTHWRDLIPEGQDTIQGFSAVGGKLFVRALHDAVPQIRVFDTEGHAQGEIEFAGIGSPSVLYGLWDSSEAFFTYESFNIPATIYRYDVASGQRTVWHAPQVPFDGSQYDVKEDWYTSKDGTRAPIFVVARKGTRLDGSQPTLLHGYGGFNVSMTPEFEARYALWLESGGVYALAILRGGGEFGEDWHRAGMLGNKQNVFDDFLSSAEWLIKSGYTNPDKLAIDGVSNGGLLMGAALTQRPDLFRVVLCRKPDLDMLRRHIGAHNVYATDEYGSAENAEQFKFLSAYSPYQHVKAGTRYPAVFLTSGDADQRVQPFQARKMTAALQWASTPGRPILLLYDKNVGHNGGATLSQDVDELTDEFSFTFWQMGMSGGD